MPTLILNLPEGETTALTVEGEIVTLGRARHNNLCIPERHVSSVHAEFRRRPDGAYEVIDLGSLNGTYVNGVRITERFGLHEGDRIVFGVIEGKFFNARPNAEDHQLTRGLEIDFLRAAEVIRANPEVAQAAAELQRKIEGASGKSQGQAPAPVPSPIPVARPAPVPGPPQLPLQAPAPMRNPTIQLVTPSRTGRQRQVILEVQEPGPAMPPPPSAGAAPDAFLPAAHPPDSPQGGAPGSPFSVAPPENRSSHGQMSSPMPNRQVPPARKTPWGGLLGQQRKQGTDDA